MTILRTLTCLLTLTIVVADSARIGRGDESSTDGLSVDVLVVDAQARPLSGVRVTATPIEDRVADGAARPDPLASLWAPPAAPRLTRVAAREGLTDDAGRVRIDGVEARGRVQLRAIAEPPAVDAVMVLDALPLTKATTRLVIASGTMLKGRVVDGAGRGLPAYVTTRTGHYVEPPTAGGIPGTRIVRNLATDADGRFAFAVPRGFTIFLDVLVPGRRIWSGVVTPGDTEVRIDVDRPDGAAAFGTVTDARGRPIAGAHVAVMVKPADWPHERPYVTALARTGEDGTWRAETLPPGWVIRTSVSHAGHAASECQSMTVPLGGERPTPIDTTLAALLVREGRVLDEAGDPVPNARVVASGGLYYLPFLPAAAQVEVLTDEDGRYRTPPLAWPYVQLAVTAKGHGAQRVEPVPQNDVVLLPGGSVQGIVRSVDGRPVAGASIVAHHPAHTHPGPKERTRTGADGTFRIDGIPVGRALAVRARLRGSWCPPTEITVEEAGAVVEADLVLQPAGRIRGRVHDETGRGIAQAGVYARRPGDPTDQLPADPTRWTLTDGGGSFLFDELPPGRPAEVVATGPAPEPARRVTASAANGDSLAFLRPTGGSVAGRVVDAAGQGVPLVKVGVFVSGRWWEVRTDASGRFGFTHLPPADDSAGYRLRLRWTETKRRYPAGTTDAGLLFEPTGGRYVWAIVVLPDGRPVPRAHIRFREGSASFGPVHAGWFRAYVKPDQDALGVAVESAFDARGERLPLQPAVYEGAVPDETLVLRLAPGKSIRGRVVDGRGAPAAGRDVRFEPADATWWERGTPREATTDAEGRFAIHGLRPGAGTLHVKPANGWWKAKPVPCATGADDVMLRSRRLVGVQGRIVDGHGESVGSAQVLARITADEDPQLVGDFHARTQSDADGRFLLARIPEGARLTLTVPRIRVAAGTWFGQKIADVIAGREEPLAVVLVRAATVSGIVQDRGGVALPGVPVQAVLRTAEDRNQANAARIDVRTDAAGHFSLGPLPPTALVDLVLPAFTGREAFHLGARVEGVTAGTFDLVVEVERAAHLSGVLMGPSEEPVPGARITLEPYFHEDREWPRRTWRSDGKDVDFRIDGLYPGRYLLLVSFRNADYVQPASRTVDVPANDLVIALRRAHPVRGRVLDETGRSQVRFLPAETAADAPAYRHGSVQRDGTFAIPNEDDVVGTIVLETRDGRFAVVEDVRPSDGPFELRAEPGARVAGRIEDLPRPFRERGRTVIRLRRGSLVYATDVDRANGFRFPHLLPAGRYDVEVTAERMRGRIVHPEQVEAGDEALIFRYEPPDE